MSLTKEQKDGLIECLYDPISSLIAGFVKSPKNFSVIEKLSKDSRDPNDRWAIWDLRYDLRWDTANKVKFESRVMAIIDAYLEGKTDGNKLPESEPVVDPNAVSEFKSQRIEQYKRDLSQTKWRELEGFWTDKTDAERDALWPHYEAAQRLVSMTYGQQELFESLKEHEAAMGLTWRHISYAPREEHDENDPSHSECAACDARREEIAEAKAKGEVYFAPSWLDR